MTKVELYQKVQLIRSQLDNVIIDISDEKALQSSKLFKKCDGNNTFYKIGERFVYNNILYKVLQAHTSQLDWTPDITPSLYTKVLIPDENVIPEWQQPDSTNGYMIGDKVIYKTGKFTKV